MNAPTFEKCLVALILSLLVNLVSQAAEAEKGDYSGGDLEEMYAPKEDPYTLCIDAAVSDFNYGLWADTIYFEDYCEEFWHIDGNYRGPEHCAERLLSSSRQQHERNLRNAIIQCNEDLKK